jgi:hypothetical protein
MNYYIFFKWESFFDELHICICISYKLIKSMGGNKPSVIET